MINGKKIHDLAKNLWPITRSIAGPGNLKTLKILKKINNRLSIKHFRCGEKVYDWKIPNEWTIKEAWIKNQSKRKVIDFKNNNLHVLNYSKPVDKKISLSELKKKIFFIKKMPNAIPYVTSYYKKDWGFCLTYNQFKSLKNQIYHVKIKSSFKKGKMSFGEILIKGKSRKEILFSTYICHPSMANNELSGMCLSIFLSKWVLKKKRKYSYRFLFMPETIGSISYIKKNLINLKKNVISGMIITCVGDENKFSYLPSKKGDGILDKITLNVLKKNKIKYSTFSWLERGSDERQYSWPNTDLSICSLMRSKYHNYKQYHTSLDNLKNFVTPKGLHGSFNLYKKIINEVENNLFPISSNNCEPMLSKIDLYPVKGNFSNNSVKKKNSKIILNVLSYADGRNSIDEIADKCQINKKKCKSLFVFLEKKKLVRMI